MSELEDILNHLETTSLEPHDDYTDEFSYKDQKILWKYIKDLQQENQKLKSTLNLCKSSLHREHEAIHRANDLEEENQELKKQLENTDYTSVYLKACEDTKDKYESQQKEFIEYLNWMFNYYQKEEQKYRTLSNRAMKVAFESVLEKYKEIMGDDNK